MSKPQRSHAPGAAAQSQSGALGARISRTGAVCPTSPVPDDGVGRYPFIVVRLMATVYQSEKVEVRRGMPSAHVGCRKSYLQHPSPFKSDGQISDEAKNLLLVEVAAAVRRTGFRMSVVWGPAWSSFVEADGSIKNSFAPPSGGLLLPIQIAFDRN